MPFVDFHSKVDYAAIFYTTNTPFMNVSSFDPEKPSIAILHPALLDLSWVDLQLGDSRLDSAYNIIALDSRSSGKSYCRLSGRHDNWVDAADLAFCFQKLHLPPCHILALEASAIYCALRFAVLFPEMCLSLTLVNVPAPVETKWISKNLAEFIHATSFADDVDTFEHAAFEFVEFMFGENTDPDLKDDLVTYWGKAHPPTERARVAETTSVYINRTPLNPELYASITQPVLILQGDKNELCPVRYAEKLSAQMTSVKDGVKLFLVKGGPMISVAPETAWTVNGAFVNFLSSLPHHRSDLVPPQIPIRDRMDIALQKLSQVTGNTETESLDPLCSLSFASLSPETAKVQTELLRRYIKDADQALDPAAVEGWSLRRYSERNGISVKEDGIGKGTANSLSLIASFTHRNDRVVAKSSTRPLETQNSSNDSSTKSAFSPTPSLDKLMKPQGTALQRLRA